MAAFVGAFALFATPAEAGGRRYYKNYYNGDCYRGGGYGYRAVYRGATAITTEDGYYRPVRYYRPAYYFPPPVFQIGFSFGGGGYCR